MVTAGGTRRAVRRRVAVGGMVQGVGFRPFVHRVATELGLDGCVANDASGVRIDVEGPPETVDRFLVRLVDDAPVLAVIDRLDVDDAGDPTGVHHGFAIVASESGAGSGGGPTALVPPDVAVCDACMAEVLDPGDRRHRYPFANCTDCGPRFTIIRSLPYDRPSTTMAGFAMCDACAAEYGDPSDRRFHAQPVACPTCGPSITFRRGPVVVHGTDRVLAAVQGALADGDVVAVKGVGGYHLACDARSDGPVGRLRARKGRGDKPFAVMVPDVAAGRTFARIGPAEEEALTSPARPIVLCRRRPGGGLSDRVAPDNPLVGIMLPYTPLHHLLFRPVPGGGVDPPSVVVLTSGNIADEPICTDDTEAAVRLAGLADAVCAHDRPIAHPCDDSVVRIADGRAVPVRRSRGFAPLPVRLPVELVPTVALGGDGKVTACVASGRRAWISQHIGDLGTLATERALDEAVASLCAAYGITPEVHAVDRHPGYRTHRRSLERGLVGRVEVQHHHAHVASVMAEHGLDGSTPVIGVAFDGTGYGTDVDGEPQIWGGEVLLADYRRFERVGHLRALPLPGGDAAVRNPCRTALAYLEALGLPSEGTAPDRAADTTERAVVTGMVARGVGCTPATSMGRLFDVVASVLDIRHRVSYEAQAAIELEAAADEGRPGRSLDFALSPDGVLDPAPLLVGLLEGRARGERRGGPGPCLPRRGGPGRRPFGPTGGRPGRNPHRGPERRGLPERPVERAGPPVARGRGLRRAGPPVGAGQRRRPRPGPGRRGWLPWELTMCLGIPGRVREVYETRGTRMAVVDFGGVTKNVCLAYVPEVDVGDYTIVHAGFAITRLDEESALESLRLFAELGALEGEPDDAGTRP